MNESKSIKSKNLNSKPNHTLYKGEWVIISQKLAIEEDRWSYYGSPSPTNRPNHRKVRHKHVTKIFSGKHIESNHNVYSTGKYLRCITCGKEVPKRLHTLLNLVE